MDRNSGEKQSKDLNMIKKIISFFKLKQIKKFVYC